MRGSRREIWWSLRSRREVLRTSLQIFIFFILTPNSSLLLPFHRYVTRQLLFIYVDLKFTITTLKPSKTLENALNPSQMRADSYVKYALIKPPQTWTLLVLKQNKNEHTPNKRNRPNNPSKKFWCLKYVNQHVLISTIVHRLLLTRIFTILTFTLTTKYKRNHTSSFTATVIQCLPISCTFGSKFFTRPLAFKVTQNSRI